MPYGRYAKLVPIVPSARRTFSNKPYLRYLAFKVPVSLFSLIPTNMLAFYLKHNMALERWDLVDMLVQVGRAPPPPREGISAPPTRRVVSLSVCLCVSLCPRASL